MIISYWIQSRAYGCECCGEFRDMEHFRAFVAVEAFGGRTVSLPKVEKQ